VLVLVALVILMECAGSGCLGYFDGMCWLLIYVLIRFICGHDQLSVPVAYIFS
jgi:hypothetical protein